MGDMGFVCGSMLKRGCREELASTFRYRNIQVCYGDAKVRLCIHSRDVVY